jgi:hypothetical protein
MGEQGSVGLEGDGKGNERDQRQDQFHELVQALRPCIEKYLELGLMLLCHFLEVHNLF